MSNPTPAMANGTFTIVDGVQTYTFPGTDGVKEMTVPCTAKGVTTKRRSLETRIKRNQARIEAYEERLAVLDTLSGKVKAIQERAAAVLAEELESLSLEDG